MVCDQVITVVSILKKFSFCNIIILMVSNLQIYITIFLKYIWPYLILL